MASNITKILFRRGTDSQRRTGGGTGVTPQAGEPIFCTDSKRLFIGDNNTVGGVSVGVTNYGQVSALFASPGYNSSGLDYAAWTLFNNKQSPVAGDLIYDQSTNLFYTLTGTPDQIPALSSFVSYPAKFNINTNQFTFSGSNNQLNIKDGGINALQINSAALDNLTLDNSGAGGTLRIRDGNITNGVTNTKLTYAPANSVKGNITSSTGSVTDLALTTGNIQFVGTTDSSNLTSVLFTSGAGIGLTVTGNSVAANITTTIAADDGIIFDQGSPVVGSDIIVNANNSLQYFKYSDFRAPATTSPVTYTVPDDGSLISMYKMDYTSPSTAKSFISFESTALGTYSPTITINWLASGANPNTIFYTNSSQKSTTYSAWSPNNYVNTMLKDGNTLYIGGQFTKMANLTARNRFAIVNLAGGSTYTSGSTYLGPMGSLSSTGVAAIDTTGLNGTVYKILKFNYSTTSYLCIAGNFTNATSTAIPGPATDADYLAIYNITAGYTLVGGYRLNSTVYDLLSSGNYLYVAGNMTTGIINAYGSPVQTTPITMDGLMRIDMSGVALSADTTFIGNVSSAITMGTNSAGTRQPIYSMAALSGILYVGGWHYAKTGTAITQKRLTAHYMNTTYNGNSVSPGGLVTTFQPIYNGNAVNKLTIDTSSDAPSCLYVGGDFTTYTPYGQAAQSLPRLMAFNLGTVGGTPSPDNPNSYSWKPNPNNTVYQIEPLSGNQNDPLYVGGIFTSIAGKSQKYLAALSKATASIATITPVVYNWTPIPNTSFTTTGRGTNILTIPATDPLSGVLISGTFTQIGGAYRRYIARVAGYNQSTPPALSSVGFDVAAATISDGGSLGVDTTSLVYVTGFAGIQDTVNVSTLVTQYNTTFSNFPQFNRGDLVRYYVRRTGAIDSSDPLWTLYGSGVSANDTYAKSVYLMSIGIDYNTKLPAPSATS